MKDENDEEEQCVVAPASFSELIAKSMVESIRKDAKASLKSSRVISNDKWEERNTTFGLFEKEEIQLGKLIGSGGFSDVYEITGFSISTTKRRNWSEQQQLDRKIMKNNAIIIDNYQKKKLKYVVKHLKLKLMESGSQTFCLSAYDLVLEAQYLSSLHHENILKLRGWAASGIDSFSNGTHNDYFLILDRLEDTLDNKIKDWKTVMMNNDRGTKPIAKKSNDFPLTRIRVARQIATGLRYLHSKRILFRDLKPSNIGFDRFGIVKIFDFGLARELPPISTKTKKLVSQKKKEYSYHMTGMVGTMRYMAPEIALMEYYNQKVDTYSWAILFWSCLTCTKPFTLNTKIKINAQRSYLMNICRNGKRPAIQEYDWNKSICTLLQQSWHQEISHRLTIVEVCYYLQQIESELVLEDKLSLSSTSLESLSSKSDNNKKKKTKTKTVSLFPHQKRKRNSFERSIAPFAA